MLDDADYGQAPTARIPTDIAKGTGMTSSRTITITLRLSHQLLAKIDNEAQRHHQDRNNYILSWLPLVEAPDPEYHSAGVTHPTSLAAETGSDLPLIPPV
jgi:hypothetical protein